MKQPKCPTCSGINIEHVKACNGTYKCLDCRTYIEIDTSGLNKFTE